MLGCVMYLQLARDPPRLRRVEHLIQHRQSGRVQLVHHQADHLRVREMHVHQILEAVRHIQDRALLGHFDMPPATLGTDEHEQITAAFALVLEIMALHLTRLCWDHLAGFADELKGTLIKAHVWALGVLGFRIQVQRILHMIDKGGIDLWNAPFFDLPGLQDVFFSVRRTVSSEIDSTTPRPTSSSASSHMVQTAWPSGGVEQASAIRWASPLASSLRLAPGRGRSLSANARLPSTNFWRVRSTVRMLTCNASAMAASVASSSARSKICARLSLRALAVPFLTRSRNSVRSASLRSTIYFLAIAPSYRYRHYNSTRRASRQNHRGEPLVTAATAARTVAVADTVKSRRWCSPTATMSSPA